MGTAGEVAAVVGIGQTKHMATRGDVSMAGLVREAAMRALADADMSWDDIDAVVVGKAPDFFEGVMMPELYLADALGAVGKPLLRVHTAGSVGGSTAIVASSLVNAGIHKRVLTVAFEKQSESEAMWALSLPIPFQAPLVAGAGGYFAPHIRAYMRRANAPDHIGILVALKDRLNAWTVMAENRPSERTIEGADGARYRVRLMVSAPKATGCRESSRSSQICSNKTECFSCRPVKQSPRHLRSRQTTTNFARRPA